MTTDAPDRDPLELVAGDALDAYPQLMPRLRRQHGQYLTALLHDVIASYLRTQVAGHCPICGTRVAAGRLRCPRCIDAAGNGGRARGVVQ